MKRKRIENQKYPFLNFTWILCFTILMSIFTGCKDDEGDEIDPEPIDIAYVSLYHVSPDAPPLDVIVDNNRINFNPFEYTEYTGYRRFFTGERELRFTPFNASNTLLETNLTLEDDSLYSIFFTGEEDDFEALVVNDEILGQEVDGTLIRVVHVSPDAPSVDLALEDEEGPLFDNVSYRNASDFVEITPGLTSFELRESGEDQVVATVSNINFLPGRVYTLLVRGFVDPPAGSDRTLGVQIVPNFFNL